MGRTLRILGIVGLVVVVVVVGVVGLVAWAAWTFTNGTPGSRTEVAAAQAAVDTVFPDYPVRVEKYRHMSFIKSWVEVTLVAVRDPGVRIEVSPWTGPSALDSARQRMKVARDGQVGKRPDQLNPTPAPSSGVSYWQVSGQGPDVDFADRRPYDWEAASLSLAVYSADDDLSAGDARQVQAGLAALGERRNRLSGPISIWRRVGGASTGGRYYYTVSVEAAASPTLESDFERVRSGAAIPGIVRVYR